jgi:hypothetical protein
VRGSSSTPDTAVSGGSGAWTALPAGDRSLLIGLAHRSHALCERGVRGTNIAWNSSILDGRARATGLQQPWSTASTTGCRYCKRPESQLRRMEPDLGGAKPSEKNVCGQRASLRQSAQLGHSFSGSQGGPEGRRMRPFLGELSEPPVPLDSPTSGRFSSLSAHFLRGNRTTAILVRMLEAR